MNKIDKMTATRNIEEIVQSMGFKKTNYIFIGSKLITQEIMIYNENRILTFFVKICKRDYKLQKFCYKTFPYLIIHSLFYYLIVNRIEINEYTIEDFENIKFSSNNTVSFFGNCGYRSFKISKKDIYGFDQSKQIDLLKAFITKVHNRNL